MHRPELAVGEEDADPEPELAQVPEPTEPTELEMPPIRLTIVSQNIQGAEEAKCNSMVQVQDCVPSSQRLIFC